MVDKLKNIVNFVERMVQTPFRSFLLGIFVAGGMFYFVYDLELSRHSDLDRIIKEKDSHIAKLDELVLAKEHTIRTSQRQLFEKEKEIKTLLLHRQRDCYDTISKTISAIAEIERKVKANLK